MKLKTYDKIFFLLIGVIIGSLIILLFFSISFQRLHYSLDFKINGYTKENALAVCSGKNLKGTSYCLNSFVRGIYKYNETKDSTILSFEELVEKGGDCKNYQELYCELSQKLNFKCKKITFNMDKYTAHTFALIYNQEGYCKLDMENIGCFMYEF